MDSAVCFLWHFPSACAAQALPGTYALWSPDFPPSPTQLGRERLPGQLLNMSIHYVHKPLTLPPIFRSLFRVEQAGGVTAKAC